MLAETIQRRFPGMTGFSSSNLWRMSQFFETYRGNRKLAPLVRELSWTHNLLILSRCKILQEREFYLRMAIREKWGKRELERQLSGALFERVVLSPPKLAPAVRELHPRATEIFKDSYLLYQEALDRDVKKPHERPSIGVLLCATKESEVVEYALSRAMSPALVAEYQTRLRDKLLLQDKLHEFYELASEQTVPLGHRRQEDGTWPKKEDRKAKPTTMITTSRNGRSKVDARAYVDRAPASPLVSLLLATLFGIAFPPRSEAARPVGEPQLERPTLHSLGVYWIIRDDPARTASVRLEFRKAGATAWRTGAPLFRVERGAHLRDKLGSHINVPADGWLFAGSAALARTGHRLRAEVDARRLTRPKHLEAICAGNLPRAACADPG